MSHLEETNTRCSNDINIMDTDGGEEDDSTEGDNVCMDNQESPLVNVEDDAFSPDISTLTVNNKKEPPCDISDFLTVDDNDTTPDASSLSLDVLDDLRLSSDRSEDDLCFSSHKPTHSSNKSLIDSSSIPATNFNCHNLESDIYLLKPVVFTTSSLSCSSNANISKTKLLFCNENKIAIPSSVIDLNAKSPGVSKTLKESTAVTSVLPNSMMTTILCGAQTRTNLHNHSNQLCSGVLSSNNSLNVQIPETNFENSLLQKNNSLQMSSNVLSRRIVAEMGKLHNKKSSGKSFLLIINADHYQLLSIHYYYYKWSRILNLYIYIYIYRTRLE